MQAAKNERGEEVNIEKRVELIPEKSPEGSTANGEVERYVLTEQGQVRTPNTCLETSYQMKIGEAHNVMPWLIMCAAMFINICNVVGEDGKTASERRRCKSSKGNCPTSARADFISSQGQLAKTTSTKDADMESTWESCELCIGTSECVIKVRTFARRGEADRWSRRETDELMEAP